MKTLKQLTLIAIAILLTTSCSTVKETAWKMKNLTSDGNAVAKLEKRRIETNNSPRIISNTYQEEIITASNNEALILPVSKPVVNLNSTINKIEVNKYDKINKSLVKKSELKTKVIAAKKPASEGKSQIVALVLAIVIGGLGIHRFYLGYTGIGIIQLLTAGGCGIWAIIDIIRIATGDLKPKDGDYTTKL